MIKLPIFIQKPFGDSVNRALSLFNNSELYSVEQLELNLTSLTHAIKSRPCIFVISVINYESGKEACYWLNQLKKYRIELGQSYKDSALRLIMVFDDTNVPIERWQPCGVHEYLFAPIMPKSFLKKIERHAFKALYAEPVIEDQNDQSRWVWTSKPIPTQETTYTKIKDTTRESRINFIEKENTIQTPENQNDDNISTEIKRTSLNVTTNVFDIPNGRWALDYDNNSNDDRWLFHLPQKEGENEKKEFAFNGEKPKFNSKLGTWEFSGESPKLELFVNGQVAETIIENALLPHKGLSVQQTAFFKVNEVKSQIHKPIKSNQELKIQKNKNYNEIKLDSALLEAKKKLEITHHYTQKNTSESKIKNDTQAKDEIFKKTLSTNSIKKDEAENKNTSSDQKSTPTTNISTPKINIQKEQKPIDNYSKIQNKNEEKNTNNTTTDQTKKSQKEKKLTLTPQKEQSTPYKIIENNKSSGPPQQKKSLKTESKDDSLQKLNNTASNLSSQQIFSKNKTDPTKSDPQKHDVKNEDQNTNVLKSEEEIKDKAQMDFEINKLDTHASFKSKTQNENESNASILNSENPSDNNDYIIKEIQNKKISMSIQGMDESIRKDKLKNKSSDNNQTEIDISQKKQSASHNSENSPFHSNTAETLFLNKTQTPTSKNFIEKVIIKIKSMITKK